ncbi:hypothetical protein UFOVP449_8 [uncultured Caudovirales phage]|uniref:Uncharacterized protein n=1 Tax=uncultured Caudovirales phage TaxID=2100421 RepID=A0A6J5M7V9_9CAUD|nr:hypothetical protein UFOVP449_8 [uncultured Caudovirales phage]
MIQFTIQFANELTAAQKRQLAQRIGDKFYPNCRPESLTVGSLSIQLEFSQDCMTVDVLKRVIENTFESINQPDPIKTITKNGTQIWPV